MKLTTKPEHQKQPCPVSCVPTCLAMALGEPVADILKEFEQLNINISDGVYPRELYYFLTYNVIGYERFLNTGLGLPSGSYLADVCSLAKVNMMHCVLVHVTADYEVFVFDPNEGRIAAKYYARDSFNKLPAMSFTRLDDFSDIRP